MAKEEGPYLVDEELLRRMGSSIEGIRQNGVRLSHGSQAIPYLLRDDGLLFFAQSPTSRYAATRAYLLDFGAVGPLMKEAPAEPAISAESFSRLIQSERLERNRVYDGRARQGRTGADQDGPWYWETIQHGGTFETDFELPNPAPDRGTLRIRLRGVTDLNSVDPDHDVDITLNGLRIGQPTWDGDSHVVFTMDLTRSSMRPGQNRLTVDNSTPGNASVDVMQLDWIEITYESSAVAGPLSVFESRGGPVQITGLDKSAVVMDISEELRPTILTGIDHEGDKVLLHTTAGMRLLVSTDDGFLQPDIVPWRESNWQDPDRQADLLIVAPEALVSELEALTARRERQGLSVAVIPVEDIFDSFGHGQISPKAIQDFISYASTNWRTPAPAYLLLVGDATYDFRAYQSALPTLYVPSLMVETTFGGETLSDSRLADIDDDGRPDLAVGRLPVNSHRELQDYLHRLLNAEDSVPSDRLIFVADGSETQFALVTNDVLSATGLQGNQRVTQLTGGTADEVLRQWNQGAWLVNYVGHGSIERWGESDLFNTSAVDGLSPFEPPPIVIQMTCLTGYFGHPELRSLTESMLFDSDGPVTAFAATSLTLSSNQTPFGTALIQALMDPQTSLVGDALQQAKLSLNIETNEELRVVSDTFSLFGDPSSPVLRP
ncbi:MAG: C25 family cysteine peptidase [Candidatus Promineifilaceae bacterium]|nr:C25 family cysteine peptidase [Candidatus Promineifilaceae bacterium]